MSELTFSGYGDYRGHLPGGETIIVDPDAHAAAVREWLRETAATTTDVATPEQYEAARAVVDDTAHWSDLVDVPGSGVRSLAALEAEQQEGRDLFPPSLALPNETLPAPDSGAWRGPWYWPAIAREGEAVVGLVGLERRYAAGLASLLDRPDMNLRVRAVIPRRGKGGGFVVVCRLGDDLRTVLPNGGPACGRLAEADLTFVLRRASSGSGRLMLDHPCRRDPEGGPPFPRPYGRLTVVGSQRAPDGAYVIGGGPVATRWWLAHEDAEHLIRRRVLPELAWAALDWWETIGAPLPEARPTWDGADPPRDDRGQTYTLYEVPGGYRVHCVEWSRWQGETDSYDLTSVVPLEAVQRDYPALANEAGMPAVVDLDEDPTALVQDSEEE